MVVPFYVVFRKNNSQAIYNFYRRRMKYNTAKSVYMTCVNHFCFGQVVMDRFASFAGKRFEFEKVGFERFEKYDNEEPGILILTAHVGCYELAGYTLDSKKQFSTLFFAGETKTVMENRARLFAKNNIRVIVAGEDMSHIFAIHNAIGAGEIVSIYADRLFGSRKVVECDFLGEKAAFPAGPFVVGKIHRVPILALFVTKKGMRCYKAEVKEVNDAQGFAEMLEETVRQNPEQWFNYFDFWEDGKAA